MKFKKGETHHAIIGHPKPYKIHICAIIDGEMVVYKYYGRKKQWWHYEIIAKSTLIMRIEVAEERLKAMRASIIKVKICLDCYMVYEYESKKCPYCGCKHFS